jgi:hypothetical protein
LESVVGRAGVPPAWLKSVGLKGNANTMERNEAATIGKAGLAGKRYSFILPAY